MGGGGNCTILKLFLRCSFFCCSLNLLSCRFTTSKKLSGILTRPNCALYWRTILCLYVPGFQRQVFKHVKTLPERSKKMKEQRERPYCGIRLQFTKCTVWPRNDFVYFLSSFIYFKKHILVHLWYLY